MTSSGPLRRHRVWPPARALATREDNTIITITNNNDNTHFGRIIFGRRMIETLEGKGRHEYLRRDRWTE